MSVRASELSIVMPNYNGETLLAENLPQLISAIHAWGGKWELIVVDDNSSDGSRELLQHDFPDITLINNEKNIGFSGTCNRGMQAARYPLVLCINTDVLVEQGFIAPLLEHFTDNSLFAVTPNILSHSEGKNQGIVHSLYGKGFLKGSFATLQERSPLRENLYAIGACVVYDLEKFRSLDGYSELYSPYLFEDVDLSYRAWKRGWRSIYDPRATVHHQSSATINKQGKRRKRHIYFRNRFLFHWANISDGNMIATHVTFVLMRLCVSFLWGDFNYYASFFSALKRLGAVKAVRAQEKKYAALGDSQIMARTE